MMKKYVVAAAVAGSLLAGPAFAQDAASCTTMLSDFDAHLAANNVQATDERIPAARTEAEQACMSGDLTAAEASLDKAVADLGIPPRSGTGETGSTEAESGDQTGAAATGTTTGGADTTTSGATGSTTTGTTGSGSDTQTGTTGSSGGTTTGGTTSTQ